MLATLASCASCYPEDFHPDILTRGKTSPTGKPDPDLRAERTPCHYRGLNAELFQVADNRERSALPQPTPVMRRRRRPDRRFPVDVHAIEQSRTVRTMP